MKSLLKAVNVTKTYPHLKKPGDRLQAFLQLLLDKKRVNGTQVLAHINLNIVRGESIGIIGENGAGKSTLLKVLSGVIQPTSGQVLVSARIAAMLELGAGFQPDFSGMENIRTKASLLGLSKKGLEEQLEAILAFADIGEKINEPIKTYSSGMVVRLGFAVITACEPDLLIADEILAVGDESFQKKCIRWLEEFIKHGGTLLLVSHSMHMVQRFCQKALWIHGGRVKQYGDASKVTGAYLAWHEDLISKNNQNRLYTAGDNCYYRVEKFRFVPEQSNTLASFSKGDSIELELRIYSPDDRPPVCVIGIAHIDGTPVYGVYSQEENIQPVKQKDHYYQYRLRFTDICLLPGTYEVRGHAMDPEGLRMFDYSIIGFAITGKSKETGLVQLNHEWS